MKHIPTEAIKNNSLKGLALLEKQGSIKAKEAATKVKPLAASLQKEMNALEVSSLYFNLLKAKERYNPKQLLQGYNVTTDTATFLAMGGNSALAWASSIVNKGKDKPEADVEDEIPGIKLGVIKALNNEKRQATFVVLEPQDDDGTTSDLHLDWYDAETVEESCRNFNAYCQKASILHLVETNGYSFIESYISPAEMTIGGKYIKKGTWLATIQAADEPEHEWIWEGIKDGTFDGLSIQCTAVTEPM